MQDKRFKRQPAAVTAGLIAAALLLVSVMAFSEIGLTRLEKEVMPKTAFRQPSTSAFARRNRR